MGAGVNVRAAHRLGAGDDEGVRMTVHSSLLVCGIIGVIVCLVCLFLAEPMLTLLRTKSELITEAVTYLAGYTPWECRRWRCTTSAAEYSAPAARPSAR